MTVTIADPKYNEAQAAAILQMDATTLNKWRCRGKGPAYLKIGGKIRYEKSALDSFLASCRVAPSERKHTRRKRARK
jgi:predicted site-specific integrase-resolvase